MCPTHDITDTLATPVLATSNPTYKPVSFCDFIADIVPDLRHHRLHHLVWAILFLISRVLPLIDPDGMMSPYFSASEPSRTRFLWSTHWLVGLALIPYRWDRTHLVHRCRHFESSRPILVLYWILGWWSEGLEWTERRLEIAAWGALAICRVCDYDDRLSSLIGAAKLNGRTSPIRERINDGQDSSSYQSLSLTRSCCH